MDREQLEERMGAVLLQIAERHRQIRAARQAEEKLQRLRAELLDLIRQYVAEEVEEPPKIARIIGRR